MPAKSKNERLKFYYYEIITMIVFYDDVAWISGKKSMSPIFDK